MSYATSDKRIEALKDERRQLISAKQTLERRIDELCAEVERLRKAKDTMHGDAFEIGAMLVKARDENAKLGEQNAKLGEQNATLGEQNATLLKLLEDMKNAPCCGNYCWMEIPQRLRDVGIEVPS